MEEKKRVHVIIKGKVQGVFFRVETKKAANAAGVLGWVRNRRDGAVEAIFEGEPERIERMLAWCRTGSPFSRVDSVAEDWSPYLGEFSSFDITY
jgi:acylphosphatase